MQIKTRRIIIIVILVMIIAFLYLYHNRFYIPYGNIFNIVPVDKDRACILYTVNVANEVSHRVGCIESENNQLVWWHELPGKPERLFRGLRVANDILTVRYYTIDEIECIANQKITGFSVSDGLLLWESEEVIYHLKEPFNEVYCPSDLIACQDNEILFENFLTESTGKVLLAIDITTGKTLWKKEDFPYYYESFQVVNENVLFRGGHDDWYILNKYNGEEIFTFTALLGKASIIDNKVWYYNREEGLQYYDLDRKETKVINSNFYESNDNWVYPHSFGRYNNKYICLLQKNDFYEIIRFSPETGEILWEKQLINIKEENIFGVGINGIEQSFPQYFPFTGQLTRFITVTVDDHENDNTIIFLIDLEEEKITWKMIYPEFGEMYCYRYNSYFHIFNMHHSEMLLVNGDTGHYELFDIPVWSIRFLPYSIGEKYLWLFNQSNIVQFPSGQWIKFDYESGKVDKCSIEGIKKEDFKIITDKLIIVE